MVREIRNRLQFLVDVGLDYLTLARPAPTLSGGETQRIRLAAQVGSGLCGVLYVLDEPTIGLHPRDNRRLLDALRKLRDLGNTLLVVEHDREVISNADQLLDFGPAAGRNGGEIVAQGTPRQVAKRRGSVTGPYLSGKKAIPVPTNRRMKSLGRETAAARGRGRRASAAAKIGDQRVRASPRLQPVGSGRAVPPGGGWLEIVGARHNNLKNINVRIPLGTLTVVTGVERQRQEFAGRGRALQRPGPDAAPRQDVPRRPRRASAALELVNKVIRVDQQPLGQTPDLEPGHVHRRVRPDPRALRPTARGQAPRLHAAAVQLQRARRAVREVRGQRAAAASRCTSCPTCGSSATPAAAGATTPRRWRCSYHGQSIADVLDMSCGEAVKLFENIPKIRRILQTLCDVGLDYLTLGQPAPTLSGGEAQRVKLAAELSRPDTGRTLYLLDEPTTGLHFDDLAKLLDVLNRLVDLGNTVVVIEHNLDVIKTADWVIDLGPEAGDEGGYVVAAGTPEDVVSAHGRVESRAARVERRGAERNRAPHHSSFAIHHSSFPFPHRRSPGPGAGGRAARRAETVRLRRRRRPQRQGDLRHHRGGPRGPMPWEIDGRRWHTLDRVGRNGNPCRWDGRILAEVIDRIQAVRPVQRDRLELAERGGDPRGEEIGRLVLPRHHRRGVAA